MTTIAYKDGVLAADTQVTASSCRVGSSRKIGMIGPVMWGAAGVLPLCQRFDAWVRGGCKGDPPPMKDTDGDTAEAIIVFDGRVVCFRSDGLDHITSPFYANGSGWRFAMGAMAAGASAVDAVRAAAVLDVHTGGEITVLSVR